MRKFTFRRPMLSAITLWRVTMKETWRSDVSTGTRLHHTEMSHWIHSNTTVNIQPKPQGFSGSLIRRFLPLETLSCLWWQFAHHSSALYRSKFQLDSPKLHCFELFFPEVHRDLLTLTGMCSQGPSESHSVRTHPIWTLEPPQWVSLCTS
jgi:hypothetical protein